jgi:chemotaxis protein MotB
MTQIVRSPKRAEDDVDDWLMTYADLITLLFAFFVILFSMSTPNKEDFEKISAALKEAGFVTEENATEDPFETLEKEMNLSLGASGYDSNIAISTKGDEVEIELSSSSFFLPGSAKFSPEAIPMMNQLVLPIKKFVASTDLVIEIEGHTDDTGIATAQFPSNWELSAARAANTVRYFISQGIPPARLKAIGLAETRPRAANRDEKGVAIPANQELNRRVVIKAVRKE